jgi:hypothetical protein
LSIGQVEGQDDYVFGEVVGAVRTTAGTIVVADGQAGELRFFDATGAHLKTVGGYGEGPGEFVSLTDLWRCEGENLCAYDSYGRFFQVWTSEAEFLRRTPTLVPDSAGPAGPHAIAFSAEGEGFVAVGAALGSIEREEGVILRPVAPVWVFNKDGDPVQKLGDFLSGERFLIKGRSGGYSIGPHPFGRGVVFALTPEAVFIGTGESFEVSVLDREGSLIQKLRVPTEDLTVTPAILDMYRGGGLSEDEADVRSMLSEAETPMPEGLPAYTGIRIDPDRNLWVRRFPLPGLVEARWGVFAATGEFLGHLDLPPRLRLSDLGRDWILGIDTDDLGIDRVQLYGLGK